MVICFLTDFGLQDDFVGTCHGVMKRIAPEAEIIDITHGIPPQAVLQGALVLASASAAEAYAALGLGTPAISIGPQTTAAAHAGGVRILAEAPTHDVDGLVEALRAWSSPS